MAPKKMGLVEETVVAPIVLPTPVLPEVVSMDLKESLELIKGINLILDSLNKVFLDGKIDWTDVTVIMDIAKSYQTLLDAIGNANMIKDELKDLNTNEMVLLASTLYPMLKEIKKLVIAIKG